LLTQERDLDHFFALSFDFTQSNPGQNVLDFAVKRSMATKVRPTNWHRYETYLLKAARANPTTIPAVVQIFASYNASGYTLGKERIGKLIRDLVRRGGPTSSHAEVTWALFLATALAIQLTAADIAPVTELDSSVCALLTLDLRSTGLIKGKIDTSLWALNMNAAALTSSNWLLAYEAELKGWLPSSTPGYVSAHPYFSIMKQLGVSFYDTTKNVKHIKARKPKPMSSALAKYLAATSTFGLPTQMHDLSLLNP